MSDLLYLSIRHALHHRVRTAILTLALSVALFLPAIVQTLTVRYETALHARARSTPLVLGARGNRYDLVLSALYFRLSDLEPIPYRALTDLVQQRMGLAIPIHLRFSARGVPIVATSHEYFEVRNLQPARGHLPLRLGDCVLGASAAARLGLAPEDTLFSDQKDAFEIARPPALKMHVVGVLAPAGTPDDDAVFVDIRTAWLLEGLMHGHAPAGSADPRMVMGEIDGNIVLNSAIRELNEITPENAASFHLHADESDLPLTCVLFFPNSDKNATIAKARANTSPTQQMLVPAEVVDDLLAFVFRIKGFLDLIALTLGACVALMTVLVVMLTVRLRAGEMRTLNRIGCARRTSLALHAWELSLILAAAVILAMLAVALAHALLPDLIRTL